LRFGSAAVAVALFLFTASEARANSALADDFGPMSQWLAHEMAQGLAFNAGSNFDPPREVKGWALQPDLSIGIGKIPFNKSEFPTLQNQALQDQGGAKIFPDKTLFPNLALHLRMGLPGRRDAYIRFADATTPPGYKISPTMTAAVQTNSIGFGLRQHLFGEEEQPTLTLGAHYNHVQGRTRLKGKFNVDIDNNFRADSEFNGEIDWSLNSFGLDAIVHKSYDSWTPFLGFGYNYATGSVRTKLELKSSTFLVDNVTGQGSDHPEQSQGRWITGVQYAKPTWSVFFNAELKALGQLQYRSWIAQIGVALPYEIGNGPKIIYKKRVPAAAGAPVEDEPRPKAAPKRAAKKADDKDLDEKSVPQPKRRPLDPKPPESQHPDMIFLQ
jgi:hypothetical protein